MSEMKCPCCGKERERAPHYNKVVAWTCSKCFFTCNNEDLPRIAAAMELAKAVAWERECDAFIKGKDCSFHLAWEHLQAARAEVDRLLREPPC